MANLVPTVPSGGSPFPRFAAGVADYPAPASPVYAGGWLPLPGSSGWVGNTPPAPCGTGPGKPDRLPGGLAYANGAGVNAIVPRDPTSFAVNSLSVYNGSAAGGTSVTLTGTLMTGITSVKLICQPVQSIAGGGSVAVTCTLGANTATTQAITTPAAPAGFTGSTIMEVAGPNGIISLGDAFTYP